MASLRYRCDQPPHFYLQAFLPLPHLRKVVRETAQRGPKLFAVFGDSVFDGFRAQDLCLKILEHHVLQVVAPNVEIVLTTAAIEPTRVSALWIPVRSSTCGDDEIRSTLTAFQEPAK